MQVMVRQAEIEDAAHVGRLVHRLLSELTPPGREPPDSKSITNCARRLIAANERVWALLAVTERDAHVGVLTLNECAAIYAGGAFGEISELYVDPDFRSRGVAPLLIAAAAQHGRERGWSRLEVGAPDLPRWRRTLDFYLKEGFVEVGPRLKLALQDGR